MASSALFENVGAYIKADKTSDNTQLGNVPVAAAAGTRNGPAVDRRGYASCLLYCAAGAVAGSPSTQTLDAKIQDSADGSTGWADVSGAAVTQITAANKMQVKAVSLSAVKRYIRVVEVAAFSGGSTPTIGATSGVILGGADVLPAA